VLLVSGQTLLKVGLNDVGGVSLFDGNPLASLLGLFRTPWIIVGFLCYGISAILWLDVLSKLDFSMAFPMVSLTYVFSIVIGRVVFDEAVGLDRVVGVLLILAGLFFIIRSGR
jgi:drug/metabolite transporter (DMT)-like permease